MINSIFKLAMKILPSIRQFKDWSLPAKSSYVGAVFGFLGLLYLLWQMMMIPFESRPKLPRIGVYSQHFTNSFVLTFVNDGHRLDQNVLANVQVENRIDSVAFRQKKGIEVVEGGSIGSNYVILKIEQILPTLSYSAIIYTTPPEIYKIRINSDYSDSIPYSGKISVTAGQPEKFR